jgi:hypothetical protein
VRALLLSSGVGGPAEVFERRPLETMPAGKEAWLQELVFSHPELLLIDEIDPGAGAVAPVCRELALHRPSGPVYLDMLGVNRRGRLVLVECKLWRNPQARREVVGQILEYAALLRRLSYADLSAKVAQRSGITADNPIWSLAADRLGLSDEARFVDAVSASLQQGAFDLVLVGDGIRSEIEAVRGYLESASGLRSRLAMVEVRTLAAANGAVAIVPQVALRTQIVEHRTITVEARPGLPNSGADADISGGDDAPSEGPSGDALQDRAFWQAFIDQVRFSHTDQPAPTHAGRNWVRIAMPKPFRHVAAYRTGSNGKVTRVGVFTWLPGEAGRAVFDGIAADRATIERDLGAFSVFQWNEEKDAGEVAIAFFPEETVSEEAQLAWVLSAADRFVSMLRPRLAIAGSLSG